jgi:hypothetical protein
MGQIVCLEAYNAFGIKAQVIHPKQFNVIQGGNATGKTSWLDIINVILYNNNPRHDVVMIGENEAIVKLETDDGLEIERHLFNDGRTDKLQVKINGEIQQGPQTLLNHLFGLDDKKKETIAVNPVELMFKLKGKGRTDKERSEIILSTIPMNTLGEDWSLQTFGKVLPLNYKQHDLVICKEAEKYWYDCRRDANSIAKATKSEVESLQKQLPENYDVKKWESFSAMTLSDKIRTGEQVNNYRKQADEIITGKEEKEKSISNKFDLQVKEQEELLEFKIKKAKDGIEIQKKDIEEEITAHEHRIFELKEEIRNLEEQIKLKKQVLSNFDESTLPAKVESLTNEMNISVAAINDRRKVELDAATIRFQNAEK